MENARDLLAANLRAECAAKGYSRAELADRANLCKSTVALMASGKQNVTIDVIAAVAKALDLEVRQLFRRR